MGIIRSRSIQSPSGMLRASGWAQYTLTKSNVWYNSSYILISALKVESLENVLSQQCLELAENRPFVLVLTFNETYSEFYCLLKCINVFNNECMKKLFSALFLFLFFFENHWIMNHLIWKFILICKYKYVRMYIHVCAYM